jgi:hypothetical protein
MSNSPLVNYTIISPNSSARTAKIDTITIHHMACDASIEVCGASFASRDRGASSNYGIGSDGHIGLYVPESRRSWCSSSSQNDNRAITIEVANDGRDPDWHVSDKALAATIDLCTDICKRNDIKMLNYTGDKSGNLTMHKWFAYTGCPGPYLGSKFPYIADEVNKRLGVAELPKEEQTEPSDDTYNKPDNTTTLSVGDVIQLASGAKYISGKTIPSWVMKQTLYVRQVYSNGNVAFSTLKTGAITGIVDRKYIVGQSNAPVVTPSINTQESTDLSVGEAVKLTADATYYNGKSIPAWVRNQKLYVRAIRGDNISISVFKIGAITGIVNKKYLTKM